jgi:type IV pilus assembly protein PilN
MIRINLLPFRKKEGEERKRYTIYGLVLSLVVIAAVIVFFHMSLDNQIRKVDGQIQAYNEEIKQLKIDTKDVNKFKAERDDLQRRLNIIYTLQRAKTGPVRVLDDLAIALPGNLWLTALKEKDGKMEIKGVSMDNPTIAQFMTNLEKSSVIKNVELVVSQQIEKKEIKLKEFTLTCIVEYGSLPGAGPTTPKG